MASENSNYGMGEITLYIGPMFAGKSSELIREVNRWKQLNWKVLCINHTSDFRYNSKNIVSHNLQETNSRPLETLMPLIETKDSDYLESKVIVIDEAQFFSDLYQFVKISANHYGKKVYCSGLDGDYRKQPFKGSQILDLIPEAENVHKLKALCQKCGNGKSASFTSYRQDGELSKPSVEGETAPVIGGEAIFESLCRFHYLESNPEFAGELVSSSTSDNLVTDTIYNKGSRCSEAGTKYEIDVYNVIKNTTLNGVKFNTQKIEELGGSSVKNDIECNLHSEKDIPIEIKKCRAPDWTQCSIVKKDGKWIPCKNAKIPKESQELIESLLVGINLYNGLIPPFMEKSITHEEWKKIKEDTDLWNDRYFDIPNTTIKDLYKNKGCHYIQISDYGLYHLGEDICNFNVPEFIIDQEIRIRTKIHGRKDKNGNCKLSVMVGCKPKDIRKLTKSPYTLDNKNRLPLNLLILDANQ